MEGARGIEPPPGFADRANGFEARGAPSTIAPAISLRRHESQTEKNLENDDYEVMKEWDLIFRPDPVPTEHG